MKKFVYYILSIGLLFSSCTKFIEEDNRSSVTAESFYITKTGYQVLFNSTYSTLRNIYGDEPWLFCAGTDLYAEGRNQEPVGLSRYSDLIATSPNVDYLYSTCYDAIQLINMAIYYAGITEQTSDLESQVGQLKFLRANAYFLLVQTYGGVSLVMDYYKSPVLSFDRNSAEEVYKAIVTDLEDALKVVPASTFDGHVNKRAIQDLLAKVHLTRGYESYAATDDFSKAATYADEVIANQGLNLTFEKLWTPGNEMNEEVIFSVQFSAASQADDNTGLGHMQSSFFGPYMGGADRAGDAPYRTYNLCPTDFAISLYTKEDTRWSATFMTEVYSRYYDYYDVADHSGLTVAFHYEPIWLADSDTAAYRAEYLAAHPGVTYSKKGTYGAGVVSSDYQTIPVRKFDDPTAPHDNGRVSTRDLILSRLGETYLVAAEAYLKAGDAATGLARLNVVRARAGVANATLAEFDIDYILDERARELMGEYHRWFDLKRTGKLVERASKHHYLIEESNFNGKNGELKILRPIPQTALDLNRNKNFTQNPAYN